MTLHTHWLPDLRAAAHEAAAILRTPAPGGDPFAPDVLVVGGRGVEQWLRRALVERLDVLTNVQIWSPSRLVSDLERWAVPNAGGSPARLTLGILSAVSRDPSLLPTELQHLNVQVAGCEQPAGPLLITWASRMARTYEQYGLYRAEWLTAWEASSDYGSSAADWQARLWRAVTEHSYPSAKVLAGTIERLRTAQASGLPPRWTVLHQGRLSPAHLSLLTALAVHHDVHVLVHAATRPLLGLGAVDVVAIDNDVALRQRIVADQHEVTNRLDRVRTDGVMLLQRAVHNTAHSLTGEAQRPTLDVVVHPYSESSECLPASLLQAVQQQARASLAEPPPLHTPTQNESQPDQSWRVYSCHGALRQVEAVKDALLDALNRDASLQPRDVLILTPDPARYVPLLQAVFPLVSAAHLARAGQPASAEHASDSAPGLPLYVQGRTPRTTNPVADVMLRLLTLAEQRVSASSVLSLIERGPIAEHFALSAADAPTIRALVREAGVRWGLDESDTQRAGLGLTDEGTWRRGINRILLGVSMLDHVTGGNGTDSNVHFCEHAPVHGLEGERALLAGRATRALRTVLELVRAAGTPRLIAEWETYVQLALVRLVNDSGDSAASATRLRDLMATLSRDASASGTLRPLSAPAVAQLLAHRMDEPVATPGQLGAITVAPLATGWVHPARVIVLLGMDDDRFPRRGGTPWFDRLAEHPAVGDPDERGEQLQTVFDALLNASDQLIITYTGWNRAGTMRLPPSVPVGALEDLLCSTVQCADPDAAWVELVQRDMPLQPFSARAFSDASNHRQRSYDVISAQTAEALRTPHRVAFASMSQHDEALESAVHGSVRILPLATLLRFLRAPAAEILSRLGVWSVHEEVAAEDVLPITLDRRSESRAVLELAEAQLHARNAEHTRLALRHRDIMPPARLGDVWLQQAQRRATFLVDGARDAVGDISLAPPEVLRVRIGDTILTGAITMRHGDTLLFLRDGKNNDAHLLKPFVTLTFAVAGGAAVRRAVLVDAEGSTILEAPPNPLEVLRTYVDLYSDADRDVPPYAPRTSLAYASVLSGDESEALHKAEGVWNPASPDARGECEDDGNALLHHVSPTTRPAFSTIARAVYEPMLAAKVGL